MRVLLAVALVALALPVVLGAPKIIDASNIDAAFAEVNSDPEALAYAQFDAFKAKYNKIYDSDLIEQHRFELFKANLATAARLQQLNPEAKFGVTKFMDLHPQEFKRTHLTYKPIVGDGAVERMLAPVMEPSATEVTLPTSFDWRKPDKKRPVAVTAVKDQGQCGSCWAFSATEEVESMWILAGHKAVALSPEQTVDCDTAGSDQGCNGGDTVTAYAYMQQAGGVEAEASYPYVAGGSGQAGTCAFKKSKVVAKIKGFTYATPGCNDTCTHQNEQTLQTNLYNHGPVSICVDASTWQTYISGILSAASGCSSDYTQLDHCVQLVGYGTSSGQKYWSVRNSWNTDWGEEGYIRLLYGANTCGVADEATIVTI